MTNNIVAVTAIHIGEHRISRNIISANVDSNSVREILQMRSVIKGPFRQVI